MRFHRLGKGGSSWALGPRPHSPWQPGRCRPTRSNRTRVRLRCFRSGAAPASVAGLAGRRQTGAARSSRGLRLDRRGLRSCRRPPCFSRASLDRCRRARFDRSGYWTVQPRRHEQHACRYSGMASVSADALRRLRAGSRRWRRVCWSLSGSTPHMVLRLGSRVDRCLCVVSPIFGRDVPPDEAHALAARCGRCCNLPLNDRLSVAAQVS